MKVKGLGRKSSDLAGFSFFFFHGSMKKFNQWAKKKKKLLKILEHLHFSVDHHFSSQNPPIDGVRKLAEEYTTTRFSLS